MNQISFFTIYLLIDQSLTASNLPSNCVNGFSFFTENRCNSFYLSKHSHSYQLINHNFPKADYRLCCNSSFVTNALQQMSPFCDTLVDVVIRQPIPTRSILVTCSSIRKTKCHKGICVISRVKMC